MTELPQQQGAHVDEWNETTAKAAFADLPVAALCLTPGGDIRVANQMAANMLGIVAADLVDGSFLNYLSAHDGKQFISFLGQLHGGYLGQTEVSMRAAGGEELVVDIQARLLNVEQAEPLLLVVLCNITPSLRDRRKLEQRVSLSSVELARTSEELHRTKELLYQVIDAVPDPVFVKDLAKRFIMVNKACCELLGQPRDQLLGRRDAGMAHEDAGNVMVAEDDDVLATGQLRSMEGYLKDATGRRRYVAVRKARFFHPETRSPILVAVARDFTERREAELALQGHNQFVQTLMDAVPSPLFYKDAKGRYQGCNAAFAGLLGLTPQDLMGKTVYDVAPPDLAEKYDSKDRELLASGGEQSYEGRIAVPSGAIQDVLFHKAVYSSADVEVAGLVGVITDITHMKRAREVLEREKDRLQALVVLHRMEQAASDEIGRYILDRALTFTGSAMGLIVLVDKVTRRVESCAMAGVAKCQLAEGGHLTADGDGLWSEVVNRRDFLVVNDYVGEYLQADALPDGHPPIRRLAAVPVVDNGEVVLVCMVANKTAPYDQKDVNQLILLASGMWQHIRQQRDAESLNKAMLRAEEANRLKSMFMANVSHELRTPVNGILGLARHSIETAENTDTAEGLAMIHTAAKSLLGVIDSMLDFSSLGSLSLEFESEPFALGRTVQNAVSNAAFQASRKKLAFSVDVAPGLPYSLVGDPARLKQVLMNLAGNAVKYTEAGGVRISVRPGQDAGPDEVELRFAVVDTGRGIAPEQRKDLFKSFCQIDGSLTRSGGGVGLGLALSKELVGRMGGRIWLREDHEQGCCFEFTARFGVASGVGRATDCS